MLNQLISTNISLNKCHGLEAKSFKSCSAAFPCSLRLANSFCTSNTITRNMFVLFSDKNTHYLNEYDIQNSQFFNLNFRMATEAYQRTSAWWRKISAKYMTERHCAHGIDRSRKILIFTKTNILNLYQCHWWKIATLCWRCIKYEMKQSWL